MKKVIRSLVWTSDLEKADVSANYKVARVDRLTSLGQPELKLMEYLTEFFTQHGEAPSWQVVHDAFEAANQPEEVVLIEEVAAESLYTGSSFEETFEVEVETQAVTRLKSVCQEALKIATVGLAHKGTQKLKGVDDAVAFLFSSAAGKPGKSDKMPSSLRMAGPMLGTLYSERKGNPQKTYGVMTGYGFLDGSTAGIRKKSLYIHAGSQGHLKSTCIFNMMINAAVDGGWNPLLFTSEMPADDVMFMLIAIHSANKKFNGVGKPLSAFRLLLGALSPTEEAFFKDVQQDLLHNSQHGSIRVVDSSEFTTFGSIQQRTIREHAETEVDMLWIDYLTRLPVDAKYRYMQIKDARNETLADAKRFAMGFDKGNGLAVGSAFQVNRDGYKRAAENEGRMDHTALSDYNAVEKEADTISYVWYGDEERATCEPKIGLIKSRWGFVPKDAVKLFIEPESRRIFDLSLGMSVVDVAAPTQAVGNSEVEL